MEERDFFISYTESDKAWAEKIADALIADGYDVYIQAKDSITGDFVSNMEDFFENSQGVIAVWSKAYSNSHFGMMEFRAAYANKMPLIPVRVEDYPKKKLFKALLHVDLFGVEWSEAEKRLLNAVHNAIPHPTPELDADALYQLGEDYYWGQNGATQDYAKAQKYSAQAAKQGHIDALFRMGTFYGFGDGVAQDYTKARYYYEQAANKGYASALYNLGVLYGFGQGVAQNYIKARDYYKQAADKGHASALYNLGVLYDFGYGVTQDYAKAREYYEQAADKGDADALYALGALYEYGQGVAQNYAKALDYFQKADDAGFVPTAEGVIPAKRRIAELREKMKG